MIFIFDVMKGKIITISLIFILIGASMYIATYYIKTKEKWYARILKRVGLDLSIIGLTVGILYFIIFKVASKVF